MDSKTKDRLVEIMKSEDVKILKQQIDLIKEVKESKEISRISVVEENEDHIFDFRFDGEDSNLWIEKLDLSYAVWYGSTKVKSFPIKDDMRTLLFECIDEILVLMIIDYANKTHSNLHEDTEQVQLDLAFLIKFRDSKDLSTVTIDSNEDKFIHDLYFDGKESLFWVESGFNLPEAIVWFGCVEIAHVPHRDDLRTCLVDVLDKAIDVVKNNLDLCM